MKSLFLGLVSITLLCTGAASATPLDCKVAPGKRICELSDASKKSFNYWCRGDACAAVWSREINALTRLLGSLEGADAVNVGVTRDLMYRLQDVHKLAGNQSWTYSLRDAFQIAMADSFAKVRGEYQKLVDTIPVR